MRFSLRNLLILFTLAVVEFASWQVSHGWGIAVSCLLAGVLFVWAVGPRRLAKLEPPVATERWLQTHAKRKNGD